MRGGATVFWIWAVSIVLVWFYVALSLGQPLLMRQHSRDLVEFGAFRGSDLAWTTAWKLIASQWVHVKFPHMLFNALVIGIVGAALSRCFAWPMMLMVGIWAGAAGQYAGAVFQPDAYISGASQAYLGLSAFALLTLPRKTAGWWVALVSVLIGIALDLFVARHGGIKAGHLVPMIIGFGLGGLVWWLGRSKAGTPVKPAKCG